MSTSPEAIQAALNDLENDRDTDAALTLIAGTLTAKGAPDALLLHGARVAIPLALLVTGNAAITRARAALALAQLGAAGRGAAPSLSQACTDKDPAVRKAALQAVASVGGDFETYRANLLTALLKADPGAGEAAARWGAEAAPLVREVFDRAKPNSKPWRAAADLLLAIAPHVPAADFEAELLAMLTHDKEAWQKLGLAITEAIRQPTLELVEPVADLTSLPEASKVLLRFPFERVKREMRSLIKSSSPPERSVGMDLAQYYGAAAEEFAPLIAQTLAADTSAESARRAVHALARLLPDDELTKALQPALDHWSRDVQLAARSYLEQLDVPVRESAWEGHPFSESLRHVLQRLGFKPRGSFRDIPNDRPLPDRPFEWGERTPDDDKAQLSRAMWALLYGLIPPPYALYTVWGSDENSKTFYFSDENPIYVTKYRQDRQLSHVFGDGSIGYFATLNLLDTSNDPELYYTERWGSSWSDGHWRASFNLSSYLRQLGTRS